jgi:hypothetical protein
MKTAMKSIATWVIIAGAGVSGAAMMTGCGPTAAYSGDERAQQIGYNMGLGWEYASDDMDNVLLLRPSSTLTQWNVWHRD